MRGLNSPRERCQGLCSSILSKWLIPALICPTPVPRQNSLLKRCQQWESEIPILSLSTTLRAYLQLLEFGGYFVYLGTRAWPSWKGGCPLGKPLNYPLVRVKLTVPILNFRRLPLMPTCLPPTKTFVVLPHRRRPLFLMRDLRGVFQVRNPNQGPAFLVAICPVQ